MVLYIRYLINNDMHEALQLEYLYMFLNFPLFLFFEALYMYIVRLFYFCRLIYCPFNLFSNTAILFIYSNFED